MSGLFTGEWESQERYISSLEARVKKAEARVKQLETALKNVKKSSCKTWCDAARRTCCGSRALEIAEKALKEK